MSTPTRTPPSVALQYEKTILVMENTTSAPLDVVPPVRPFRALRQPVYHAGCRRAFFYLLKGVKEYEFKIYLPKLRNSPEL